MPLTDYEKEREENILRNKAVLELHGIHMDKKIVNGFYGEGRNNGQPVISKKRVTRDKGSVSEYDPFDEETETDDGIERENVGQKVHMSHVKAVKTSKMAPGTRPEKRARGSSNSESSFRSTRSRPYHSDTAHMDDGRSQGRGSASDIAHQPEGRSLVREPQDLRPSPTRNSPEALRSSRLSDNITEGNSAINITDEVREADRQPDEVMSMDCEYIPTCSKERQGRRPTTGWGLLKYTERTGSKMHISFTEGKRRSEDPVQAAKLSSECGVHIRNHVRVATHWKMYKQKDYDKVIPEAIAAVAGKFDMNKNDDVAQKTCTDVLKCGIRQQCYRLKKKYFNNVLENEIRSKGPPPNINPADWNKLLDKWFNPKNKETCEKNKMN